MLFQQRRPLQGFKHHPAPLPPSLPLFRRDEFEIEPLIQSFRYPSSIYVCPFPIPIPSYGRAYVLTLLFKRFVIAVWGRGQREGRREGERDNEGEHERESMDRRQTDRRKTKTELNLSISYLPFVYSLSLSLHPLSLCSYFLIQTLCHF